MKLKNLEVGQTAKIIKINENKQTCLLCSIGFEVGEHITIIQKTSGLIVKIKESKYAIGKQCFDCIEVDLVI